MEDIQKKFNLPKYIHGKSFADASKLIEKKFNGRTDKEAMDTKNDLMSRLRDAQEYLKETQAYKEESSKPQEPTHTMPDGTVMPGEQHQYMHGGYKKTNDYNHGGLHDDIMPPGMGRDPFSTGNNQEEDLDVAVITEKENENENDGNGKFFNDDRKEKIENALISTGRLAPAAMNLAQLASLKKAENYRGARLNSTYEKQITDEAALQNAQAVENRAQRNAMRSNSGSQSMLLNNLRGQGLNALKAQGDAYMKSRLSNQQENRKENAFNARQEEANVAYSRQDDMINMQNEGAYDTTKSALMAGLATDVGKMSKEALFKKYPELMGMDYDWLGKFSGKDKKKKNKNKTQDSQDCIYIMYYLCNI